jgi:photosystem II stability/assembly factor-like uncharacterized protein
MRKAIILISLIIFYFVSYAQEEWTLIHPYPTLNNLIDAHFVSEQEGWVVGTDGLIMYTEDGGNSWDIQHSDPDESIWSIFFIDDNEGWAVGWSSIYHTTNAGNTWEEQNRPPVLGDLTDVYFVNRDTGWIVGTYKIVLKTTDGGDNWTKIMNTLAGDKCFYSVSFTNELHGCAVGGQMTGVYDGFIMVTNDGGLAGHQAHLTQDGGETWDSIVYIGVTSSLVSFTSWGYNQGIAVGYAGSICKTLDGGNTWENLNSGMSSTIRQIGFFNSFDGFAIIGYYQTGSLIRSTDGGYTWHNDTLIDNGPFYKMWMSGSSCYLLNKSSQMMKTTNGGEDWELIDVPTITPYYNDLQFVNENTAYMCSSEGILVKTNDGGVTWLNKSLVDEYDLRSLFFINENKGWLIDYNGKTILRTTTGGDDWTFTTLGDVYIYQPESIFFINEDEGFVTTDEGVIFKTINGGDTWEEFYTFPTGSYSKIYFVSETEGWYKSGYGIYHTYDGGISWVNGQSFSNTALRSLFFLNNDKGWLGGGRGLVATYNSTVDINEFSHDFASVSVFPNPAHEDVIVNLHDESDQINDIKVFNIQGQWVLHISNLSETNSFKFNVSGLISGAYILHLTTPNRQYLVKFIKQ